MRSLRYLYDIKDVTRMCGETGERPGPLDSGRGPPGSVKGSGSTNFIMGTSSLEKDAFLDEEWAVESHEEEGAFSLPSCDEPQTIIITRGQKISVVYWLGQNHPGDESLSDTTTQASSSGDFSHVSLKDSSPTQPLDSNEATTTEATISSSFGHSDSDDGEQRAVDGVHIDTERDSRISVDDNDVANYTANSLNTGVSDREGREDEMDFTSSSSTVDTDDLAGLSSNGSVSSFADDVTDSWAIVFTETPKDPDILVDPRDPAANNFSIADSKLNRNLANLPNSTMIVKDAEVGTKLELPSPSSTIGSWKESPKAVILDKTRTLLPVSASSSSSVAEVEVTTSFASHSSDWNRDPSQTSFPSATVDATSKDDYFRSTTEVPSSHSLHESPVHYVTVVHSPDGTLPIHSLNASLKQHTSQRQISRNKRSPNVTLCKWIFKSDPGVPLLLTFKTFSTPETVDCKDHYIAVERESNGFQSRWCGVSGDRPGHASFARSQIGLYLSSNGDGSFPTGFSIEVQALDLKLLRKYAEVRRIIKSQ